MNASAQTSSKKMKRLPVYLLLTILLVACGGKGTGKYTIQGEGVGEGTVYLYGSGDVHKQLTSMNCENKFTLQIPLESNATLTLILPNEKALTLFAKPGVTATLHADSILESGWAVMGCSTQQLHDSISRILDTTEGIAKQKKIIEEFSKSHPTSEIIVELFRRYLVDIPTPDNEYIRKNIEKLSGTMQDHEYFSNLKRRLKEKTDGVKGKAFPSFSYKTFDHGTVNLTTFSKKYLLVTFWGTWNSNSLEYMKKLNEVQDSVKGESFAILNIALESDTAKVRKFIQENNIPGYNACDPKGMNSENINRFNTTTLPYSVLVNGYKYIYEAGFRPDSANIALIDSLVMLQDKKLKK